MNKLFVKVMLMALVTVNVLSNLACADTPSVHGMLLFGDNKNYASHLPMFHYPHNYQLIMQISLSELQTVNSKTLELYEKAKKGGHKLFTLVPEVMDLSKLISGEKKSFKSSLYLGHFERGGKNLGLVNVKVEKLLYAKNLSEFLQTSEEAQPSYLVFGEKGEYYSLHLVQSKPSFDTLLQVKGPYKLFYPSCGRGSCLDPVAKSIADEKLPLTINGSSNSGKFEDIQVGNSIGELDQVMIDINQVIYKDDSDLK